MRFPSPPAFANEHGLGRGEFGPTSSTAHVCNTGCFSNAPPACPWSRGAPEGTKKLWGAAAPQNFLAPLAAPPSRGQVGGALQANLSLQMSIVQPPSASRRQCSLQLCFSAQPTAEQPPPTIVFRGTGRVGPDEKARYDKDVKVPVGCAQGWPVLRVQTRGALGVSVFARRNRHPQAEPNEGPLAVVRLVHGGSGRAVGPGRVDRTPVDDCGQLANSESGLFAILRSRVFSSPKRRDRGYGLPI